MIPEPCARVLGRLATRASGLAGQRDGNVAILFGVTSVPLLMITGAAIDYGLATRLETKLQAATDSTALLLCQTPLNTSTTALNTMAQVTMSGAMGPSNLVVDPLVITDNPRQITLRAHKVSTTYFGKFTGTASLNPGASARCATPLPKTFEIALVLDNTGSMTGSSGGQTKLQAVRQAAEDFVNYVYNSSSSASFSDRTKISIVPFASSVAVDPSTYRYASWIDQNGASSYHWSNVLSPGSANFKSRFGIFTALQGAYSGWGWAGCLETLPYPQNVRDGGTTASADSLYVPMFAPDEPGKGTTSYADYTGNNVTSYSFNSYIDDSTNSVSCPTLSSSTSFNAAEGRACKYLNARNASPTNTNYLGVPNGPNSGCTTKPLQRLTNNTTTLKALINGMVALGSTNIHEGFMWGWRTLSPNSVFADGAPYTPSTATATANAVNKVIILMTDGENTWSASGYSPNGSLYGPAGYFQNADGTNPNSRLPPSNRNVSTAANARAALDALTLEACTNAKDPAVNISIYTIGFSTPADPIDAAGQALLKNCASKSDQFFIANTSDDLIEAFNKIKASIGALRLTQ